MTNYGITHHGHPAPKVHVVERARTFVDRGRSLLRLDYQCGGHSKRGRLLGDPGDGPRCMRCDFDGLQTSERMLYAGITPDGLLKVGVSKQVSLRTQSQQLDLIGVCPGSYAEELALVKRLAPAVTGREWFDPTPDRLALVDAWMAERRAS